MGNEVSVTPAPESLDWPPDVAAKKEEQRQKVAREIVDTEKTYVDGLQILRNYWLTPLKSKCKGSDSILSEVEIREIFINIDLILEYHQDFLRTLQSRLKKFTPATVLGDIWVKKGDYFAVYAEFINGYDAGSVRLKEAKEDNKKFHAFNETVYHEHQAQLARLRIEDFLIMPVQRLPRYKLLLTELQKATPGTHRDYGPISGAIDKISELLSYINQQKRAIDDESTLEGLTNVIDVPKGKTMNLLSASRIIRHDVELIYTNPKGKTAPCRLVLFNDGLLVLKQNKTVFAGKKKWKFVAHESFSDTWVQDGGIRWPKYPDLVLVIKDKQLPAFQDKYHEVANEGKVDGGELPVKEGFLKSEFLIFSSERWVVLKLSSLAWYDGSIQSTRKEQGRMPIMDIADCTTDGVAETEFALNTVAGRKVWKARDKISRDEWVVAINRILKPGKAEKKRDSEPEKPKKAEKKDSKHDVKDKAKSASQKFSKTMGKTVKKGKKLLK